VNETRSSAQKDTLISGSVLNCELNINIATCIPIARQRLDKHAAAVNTFNNKETAVYMVRAPTITIQLYGKYV
jgi:hypothetical protein